MFYNYVQALDGVFFRYLNGYSVTYFNEDNNCRPKDLTSTQALLLGVFPLQIVTPPYHNPMTQELALAPAIQVNGVWTQVYKVVDLDKEQKAQAEIARKEANKQQAIALLQQTDWTQVSDAPLLNKQVFTDYRAAVRAIAINPPVEAVFPSKPDEVWSDSVANNQSA
jgi:hypothetical protein